MHQDSATALDPIKKESHFLDGADSKTCSKRLCSSMLKCDVSLYKGWDLGLINDGDFARLCMCQRACTVPMLGLVLCWPASFFSCVLAVVIFRLNIGSSLVEPL